MEMRAVPALRMFAVLVLCVFTIACGNGHGDTASTEVSVEGSWSGTFAPADATRPMPVYALIQKDGIAFFYDGAGIMYRMPRLDGGYTFQGSVRSFAPIGYRFKPDAPDALYRIQGTAADSAITGEMQNDSGTGQLELTPFDTYRKAPAIADGQWIGYYITPTPYFVSMVVDARGSISGDDVFGCHLTGRIRQHRDGENLFEVALTTTGPKPICGETFSGLAHEEDYDTMDYFKRGPGKYYYMGLFGKHSAFAAEFKLQ